LIQEIEGAARQEALKSHLQLLVIEGTSEATGFTVAWLSGQKHNLLQPVTTCAGFHMPALRSLLTSPGLQVSLAVALLVMATYWWSALVMLGLGGQQQQPQHHDYDE
jgi:hypothetical protein